MVLDRPFHARDHIAKRAAALRIEDFDPIKSNLGCHADNAEGIIGGRDDSGAMAPMAVIIQEVISLGFIGRIPAAGDGFLKLGVVIVDSRVDDGDFDFLAAGDGPSGGSIDAVDTPLDLLPGGSRRIFLKGGGPAAGPLGT